MASKFRDILQGFENWPLIVQFLVSFIFKFCRYCSASGPKGVQFFLDLNKNGVTTSRMWYKAVTEMQMEANLLFLQMMGNSLLCRTGRCVATACCSGFLSVEMFNLPPHCGSFCLLQKDYISSRQIRMLSFLISTRTYLAASIYELHPETGHIHNILLHLYTYRVTLWSLLLTIKSLKTHKYRVHCHRPGLLKSTNSSTIISSRLLIQEFICVLKNCISQVN